MPKTGMMQTALPIAAVVALCTLAFAGRAQAQGAAPPDISGSYRCQPNSAPCAWPGQTPSISQSGNKLQIKNDKGETANALFTSDITISAGGPLNSFGTIRPDHSIDWSDGTKWRKQ
jgi:hypothetical protein